MRANQWIAQRPAFFGLVAMMSLCIAFTVSQQVMAQGEGRSDRRLGLPDPSTGLDGQRREALQDLQLYSSPGTARIGRDYGHRHHELGHPYLPYYYYGYYPWYRIPQTVPYRHFYHNDNRRTGYTPSLGLYVDPWGWEMGVRTPIDSEPLEHHSAYTPTTYRGVVAAALKEHGSNELLRGRDSAIDLIKAGKYRQAGLLLADGFQREGSARYPLLLTEVFVALGKHRHAELLLEHALYGDGVTHYLPRNMATHFASQDEFKKISESLIQAEAYPLLRAYFLLHSETPEKGLDVLLELVTQDANNEAASVLYRHYLSRVFGGKQAASEKK